MRVKKVYIEDEYDEYSKLRNPKNRFYGRKIVGLLQMRQKIAYLAAKKWDDCEIIDFLFHKGEFCCFFGSHSTFAAKSNLSVSKFNEFKPRLKSPKNRFQLTAGLNLEKLNTILIETNHI